MAKQRKAVRHQFVMTEIESKMLDFVRKMYGVDRATAVRICMRRECIKCMNDLISKEFVNNSVHLKAMAVEIYEFLFKVQ
jgi:hypothetical protein